MFANLSIKCIKYLYNSTYPEGCVLYTILTNNMLRSNVLKAQTIILEYNVVPLVNNYELKYYVTNPHFVESRNMK